ncbi:MAG: hypothetical protein MI784_14680 [Cytophagales bacterium]|nr:hypothetical protein [Cytophagales bacterium]
MKKNTFLLLLFLGLGLANALLFFKDYDFSKPAINYELFAVDRPQDIDAVVISQGRLAYRLEREKSGWELNGKTVRPKLIELLLKVLKDNRIEQALSKEASKKTAPILQKNGILVSVESKGLPVLEFYAGGDRSRTTSYLLEKGSRQVYTAGLPGHDSFIAGLFEIPETEWTLPNAKR